MCAFLWTYSFSETEPCARFLIGFWANNNRSIAFIEARNTEVYKLLLIAKKKHILQMKKNHLAFYIEHLLYPQWKKETIAILCYS